MHAVVTLAIERTVLSLYGPSTWDAICRHAGVPSDGLLSPGERLGPHAFELATAASLRLGVPRQELLEACGEFWAGCALIAAPDRSASLSAQPPLPEDAPQLGRLHEVYLLAQGVLRHFGADACMLLPTGHGGFELQVQGAGVLVRELLVGVCKALSRAAGLTAEVRSLSPEETRGLALHRVEVCPC
ncbi:hypothetical protein IP84_08500 [beta proteobacterium AAP99]|nr:hypothetical protein IP84_08500 [beta proteobacterium AAP99]